MIDLHLHLDGSLSENDFRILANKQGVSLGKTFPDNIYVPADCPSLEDYLTRFALPCALLQDKDSLSYVTESLVKRLDEKGFVYAEIRFAPLLHLEKGLTQLEVAKAVLNGLEKGLKQCKQLDANIILCCMRHASEEINMGTVEVAHQLKGTKVVAVDLAGAEALHPSSYYGRIFGKAKEYGLNITIHAGEATGSDEIMMAMDNGASRIGHGVHLSLDSKTIARVKKENTCFEFCPTSNLQTKSLKTYQDVPLRQFIENNIPVTINSDNMTVSNTDAIREMSIMKKTFNLSQEEVLTLLKNSVLHAFTSEENTKALLHKLEERIDDYYSSL